MSAAIVLEVYVTPPAPEVLDGASVIVIDVLRATTVHDALFAGGANAVYPAADFAAGIGIQAEIGEAKLIGEIRALPPPDADFGNSPAEFAARDVRGWTIVHVTGNGTRALLGARGGAQVLSGCLRNRSAAVRRILSPTTDRIAVVCSGDHGGTAPSIEDTFAAGAYVAAFRDAEPDLILRGGARLALRVYEAYERNPKAAFGDSPHADCLLGLGFEADLAYAETIDASAVVAVLDRDAAGRAFLRPQ